MSYPQPSSNKYSVGGVDFFRLLTNLTSPGDIYESEQSGHAFALGPQSDVANVNVGYFDDQVQTFLNQTQIGPRRSFVGRLDARNVDTYTPANRPGRLYFWPADLYDPSYTPATDQFEGNTTFITPVLDVIQYFKTVPLQGLVPERNDKTYRFLTIPEGTPGLQHGWIVIPYWGRQSAVIRIQNLNVDSLDFQVRGVDYFINDQGHAMETPLFRTQLALGMTTTATLILNSNPTTPTAAPTGSLLAIQGGIFDALAFNVSFAPNNIQPFVLSVSVSDDPG